MKENKDSLSKHFGLDIAKEMEKVLIKELSESINSHILNDVLELKKIQDAIDNRNKKIDDLLS